ncbi:hypothetical protein [Streptomyces tailanensis]
MAYAAHIVDLLAGMLLQGEFDVEPAAGVFRGESGCPVEPSWV